MKHHRGTWIGVVAGLVWAVVGRGAALETPRIRFEMSPETGAWRVMDKAAGVAWTSNPFQPRFGEAAVWVEGKRQVVSLGKCEIKEVGKAVEAVFRPVEGKEVWVKVRMEAKGENSLAFSYEGSGVESVRLVDQVSVTAEEKGYVVVPVREGLLIPADSGIEFAQTFDTYAYEGCHMTMVGIVKGGAAALMTWDDPYAAAEVKSYLPKAADVKGSQVVSVSLGTRQSARGCTITFLGKGDYVSIAKAYREVAKTKGWVVTWDQKLAGHPERAKYFGASNYKLWSMLTRKMNEDSTKEESLRVNWTFDEAAQVAEHLKNDLKMERVLFILGGWIKRGYDNQHPDILPAAPECGGDDKFTECSKRIRALGYILSLHDNYQDMYKDSPSWDESFIQRRPGGELVKGGHWDGGDAYITCAQKAVELAKRPQNLPAVKKLTDADSYFIDTTYAAGLQECFDPKHPLTRADDMKWKQAISDYAREVFGSFGSECGREWAIPHADFFEGLTGVSGTYYHNKELMGKVGGTVVPLFEMVYRDCIAMYGKYGYDINNSAEYVIHHISIGRPLNYHNVPSHLYWKQPVTERPASEAGMFVRGDGGWTAGMHPVDRFVKNTHEILSPLNEITSKMTMTGHEFLTADRKVRRSVFGEGNDAVVVVVNGGKENFTWKSKAGGEVVLPQYGFVVEGKEFAAFCAKSWGGIKYEGPAMFTLRSLDGRDLPAAKKIRVFHGFGDARVMAGGAERTVPKELVIE
jgi:hypothetical protein